MQRTTRCLFCLIAALLLCSPVAWAKRELEFGQGLLTKGYFDIAREQLELLEADKNAPEDTKVQACLLIADCYSKEAETVKQPDLKDGLLAKAAEQLSKFLKTHEKRPEALDARMRVATLNLTRAQDKDKLIQATQDTKLQAKLKDEAVKLFDESANTFADIVDQLEKKVKKEPKYLDRGEKQNDEEKKVFEAFLLARAQQGWSYYYLGQLYGHDAKDKDKMKKAYMDAQGVFQPFLKDYPSFYITLWVQCGQGLVYRGLGDWQKGVDEFRRVVMKRRTEETKEIRYQAYFWLVETLRQAQQFDDAIRNANRFVLEATETYTAPIAQAIKLEKSKAYAEQAVVYKREKKDKEAAANLEQVKKLCGELIKAGGEYADAAAKLLQDHKIVQEVGAPQKFAAASKLMSEAQDALTKKDLALATTKFRAALQAWKQVVEVADPEQDAPMLGETWYQMAFCYYNLSTLFPNDLLCYYETGLAFGQLAREFPENPFAPKAAYLSGTFLGLLYNKTPETMPRDYEAQIYMDALIYFVEKFPNEKEAPKYAYQVGETLRSQKKYLKAASVYSNIPTFSDFYERGQYMAGNCHWLGFLDLVLQDPAKAKGQEGADLRNKVVEKLKTFIEWGDKQPPINPQRDADRAHWVAASRVLLASVHADEFVKKPELAVEDLKDFETRYPGETKLFPQVACLRVEAMAWTNQLPQALGQMKTLIEKYGQFDPKSVSKAARTVGSACAAVALKPPVNLATADVDAYRANAIFYLDLSISRFPDQPFADYVTVGDKLMELKEYTKAVQIYTAGVQKHRDALIKEGRAMEMWTTLAKLAESLFNLSRFQEALAFYKQLDEFVKGDRAKFLAYKDKIGICYESLGQWQQALDEGWNILIEKLTQNTPKWLEAKIHQIHCFAKNGDDKNASRNFFQAVALYWDAWPEETRQALRKLLEQDLPGHKDEFEDFLKKMKEGADPGEKKKEQGK